MNWYAYFIPPVTGALIGYLTNKIAIRMLFRPLNRWQIFGVKIPMTPGVIPSKRFQLARNIGKMVGSHLLTAEEISRALDSSSFQNHLYRLIEQRIGGLIKKTHFNVSGIVPETLKDVYNSFIHRITSHFIKHIHEFLQTEHFVNEFGQLTNRAVESLFEFSLNEKLNKDEFIEEIFNLTEDKVSQAISGTSFRSWLQTKVQKEIFVFLQAGKSISDILPESAVQFLVELLQKQVPNITDDWANIVKKPQIQEIIAEHIHRLVLDLFEPIGTMGGFLKNVAGKPAIKKKIIQYINHHENEIGELFLNETFRDHLADVFGEQIRTFLHQPLVNMISQENEETILQFCSHFSDHILQLLKRPEFTREFFIQIAGPIRDYINQDNLSYKTVFEFLLKGEELSIPTDKIIDECRRFLETEKGERLFEEYVRETINTFLSRPIESITDFVDNRALNILYRTLQKMATQFLAIEMVGLTDTLNIEEIVSEKVNSFDLEELEILLLSIMADQFKYINLFGAIIGFLIGCCNIIFIASRF